MERKARGFKVDDTRERRTRVVSTRMDDRTLALLSEEFDRQQVFVKSLSELVYLSCRSLLKMFREDVLDVDLAEARQYLSKKFNIPVDPPGQKTNAYVKQLQTDQAFKRRKDYGGPMMEGGSLPRLDSIAKDFSSARTLTSQSESHQEEDFEREIAKVKFTKDNESNWVQWGGLDEVISATQTLGPKVKVTEWLEHLADEGDESARQKLTTIQECEADARGLGWDSYQSYKKAARTTGDPDVTPENYEVFINNINERRQTKGWKAEKLESKMKDLEEKLNAPEVLENPEEKAKIQKEIEEIEQKLFKQSMGL